MYRRERHVVYPTIQMFATNKYLLKVQEVSSEDARGIKWRDKVNKIVQQSY